MRKYKKYMLLLLTVIFMFALSGVALAADDMQTITKDSVTYEFPDVKGCDGALDEYMILNVTSGNSGIYVFFGQWYVNNTTEPHGLMALDTKASGKAFYAYYIEGKGWCKYAGIGGCSLSAPSSREFAQLTSTNFDILYSTYDVKVATGATIDTVTDEVFFKAPPVGQLKTILKRINLGGALSEVVSLMPLVLLVILLYLGLRKGLSFLSTALRRA